MLRRDLNLLYFNILNVKINQVEEKVKQQHRKYMLAEQLKVIKKELVNDDEVRTSSGMSLVKKWLYTLNAGCSMLVLYYCKTIQFCLSLV